MTKPSEEKLAEQVIKWLEERGWYVYQEVQTKRRTIVADIVAVRGPIYWVVEVKTSLGLAVLSQAVRWRDLSHMRAVAVPQSKRDSQTRWFAERIARDYGVGIIRIPSTRYQVTRYVPGDFESKPRDLEDLKGAICSAHQTYAKAGSAGGGHYTEFKGTVIRLREYLTEHPGATMRQVVDSIDHHYSSSRSARATLLKYINESVIAGIRKEKEGRHFRFYLDA